MRTLFLAISMVSIFSTARAEEGIIAPDGYIFTTAGFYGLNIAPKSDSVIVLYIKNRDTLIGYIEGQQSITKRHPYYAMVLSICGNTHEDCKDFTIETSGDAPYHSVKTECPESAKAKECYFIKYDED